ncbi:MAG: Uma2 family endonuclease [Acetobacteraceae bacterium]
MSQALRRPLLTVDAFHAWEPPPGTEGLRWELVDGEPAAMAPPSVTHGAIQSQVSMLLGLHLRAHRPGCRVITTPGVIPHLRSRFNERMPDLGVSCAPFTNARALPDPILLVEILSPSNEARTRANAWAYATIPSVQDVLILSSTAIRAEILRRGDEAPEIVIGTEILRLDSISYAAPLAEFHATTDLA